MSRLFASGGQSTGASVSVLPMNIQDWFLLEMTSLIIKKIRNFQKNIYFCFIDYAKAFDCWITVNCGKFWKRGEYQTTWFASWEICMQDRKQQLELDMEQQNMVPNRKRSMSRLYIVTLLIQLIWRVHHEKHWAGRSTSWNQDCQEK